MKCDYTFLNFKLSEINEMQDYVNRKADYGFKLINIHYYTLLEEQYVRIVMEREA